MLVTCSQIIHSGVLREIALKTQQIQLKQISVLINVNVHGKRFIILSQATMLLGWGVNIHHAFWFGWGISATHIAQWQQKKKITAPVLTEAVTDSCLPIF